MLFDLPALGLNRPLHKYETLSAINFHFPNVSRTLIIWTFLTNLFFLGELINKTSVNQMMLLGLAMWRNT